MRPALALRPAAALIALASALAAAGCGALGRPAPPRNVILITIDTLRADKLSRWGGHHIHTPALDSLADDGVVFENAFSLVPLTAPAHSTMMTGRYPATHGVKMNGSAILPGSETTLAEIAATHGMRTGAIVSCLVLSSRFGINQGFDLYFEEGITGEEGRRGLWYDERKASASVARAIQFVRAESETRFLLWLHLFDPHHPYEPPPPFNRTYAARPYDGEIVYADRALGGLLRTLKEMDLYDDALIMVTGDHGESLGDHLESFHGTFVYDATTHVPMIIKAPGGRRGAREAGIASIIDVMPTIVDALGLEIPEGNQGVSLMPAVYGTGSLPERPLYMESIYPAASYGWAEVRGLRTADWKFLDLPTPELYKLGGDADELDNVYAEDPILSRDARARYEELRERLESARSGAADAAQLDDSFRDRLLSLGYIAGTESAIVRENARDPKEVVLLTQPVVFAQSLLKEKKFDEAVALLVRAIGADPENKLALVTLGRAYAGLGKDAEAREIYRRAIAIYPDNEEIYRLLGWMLIREGDALGAADLMAGLVAQTPRSAQAHYLYGFAWFYAGAWEKALAAFQEASSLSSSQPKAHYLAAICLERTGRRAEALAALDRYLKLEPDVESLFRDPFFAELRESAEFRLMIRRYL